MLIIRTERKRKIEKQINIKKLEISIANQRCTKLITQQIVLDETNAIKSYPQK
jgi:hypothetical protein